MSDDDQVNAARALFERLTAGKKFELGQIRIPTSMIDEPTNYPQSTASYAMNAAHIVDRDGCRSGAGDPCLATNALAHELDRAFAWVDWVSVQHSNRVFVVKVKHSYPVDVRPELRAWLVHSNKFGKQGAAFELQVKATKLEPVRAPIIIDDPLGTHRRTRLLSSR